MRQSSSNHANEAAGGGGILNYARAEPKRRPSRALIVQACCSGMGLLLLGGSASAFGAWVVVREGIGWGSAAIFSFGVPFLAAGVLRMRHVLRAMRGLPDLERSGAGR
jgi:hypothetical protein